MVGSRAVALLLLPVSIGISVLRYRLWDLDRLVSRTVDDATGAIDVLLEYPEHAFRYRVRAVPEGGAVKVAVVLDQPAVMQRQRGLPISSLHYLRLGIVVTPPALLLGALALWLSSRLA